MANRKARVTQAEITRALKAASSAGLPVARYEVAPDGSLRVFTLPDTEGERENDWDTKQ